MAVNIWGIVAIAAFYLVILVIGILAARRVKSSERNANSEEVVLAGRNIGLTVGAFTMTATWVGGGYINGTAEGVYNAIHHTGSGLVMTQAPIGYSISLFVGGLFFAKRMRSAGYVTMLDPLQKQYGNIMGGLLYIPALSGELFWSASILAALGSTLTVIVDIEIWISIIISASIAMLYTVIGGLYSVAYTDVVQLACIFLGLTIALPFAFSHAAVKPLLETASDDDGGWLGFVNGTSWGSFIDSYFLLIFGGIPWQEYFQRVLASPSPKTAQHLSFIASFGCLVLAIPPALIGAVGYSTDWNQTEYTGELPPDGPIILPLVLQYLTPTAVSFIGLGAVSAAVMSSADSTMLGASTMFAKNIYGVVFRPKASESEIIWVIRIGTLIFGVLAVLIAISVKSIYGLFHLCGDFVYVMLFPQLTAALFINKANTYGSAAAYIISLLLRLLCGEPMLGLPAAIHFPWYDQTTKTQQFPVRTFCMLTGMLVLVVSSWLTDWLFKSGKLSAKYDILHGVVKDAAASDSLDGSEMADIDGLPKEQKLTTNEHEI